MTAYRGVPHCPRCQHRLELLSIPAGSAWGCELCAGVLLDDEAFGYVRTTFYANISSATGSPPVDLLPWDPSAPLKCPACDSTMKRTELAGVAVDFCAEHGTWFDARELTAVAYSITQRHPGATRASPVTDFEPWASSPETARELASLHEQLRLSVNHAVLSEALRQLQRSR